VAKVEFYVDGILKGTDTSSAFTYSLNPGDYTSGSHSLVAKAYDATGNSASSAVVSFTVRDSSAPTVSLTSPAAGASVSGTITLSANASDDQSVTKVEFYVDGATMVASDSVSPYTTSFDTKTLTNGSHSFTAKAYDAANNSTTSSAVNVTVNNVATPPVDRTDPSVSITNPAAGSTISNTVTVSAAATDNVGVTKVEFYIDGTLKYTAGSSPFNFSLNTSTLTNGSHSFTAKAYDAANNSATSQTVTANVRNGTIIPEDINMDGMVDIRDFSLLASKFGQTGNNLGRADIDGNNVVDIKDFSRLASKFGS
jgi:hypothetical protein